MAELVKHIDTHIEMDFMMVSSYHGGTASSGVINIKQDVTQDIKGRHVLFVEDIIDTGQTLKKICEICLLQEKQLLLKSRLCWTNQMDVLLKLKRIILVLLFQMSLW